MSRVDNALLLRDTIQKIVDDKIGKTNPGASYATVTGFNPALGIVTVRYPGDDVDIEIPAGSIYPSEPGQIVRIDGPPGARVIADVKGENLTEVKARTAQETADGKNTVNYGETPPEGTDHKDGDIWFDEGNSNMPNVWRDGQWVTIEDLRVSAIADAQAELREDLDTIVENGVGTKSFYKPTQPTEAESKEGDLWFDTSEGGKNELHTYVNGAWVSAADARIAAIQQAQAEIRQELDDIVIDGSGTKNFYTPDMPTEGMSEGDLWFDGSNKNKPYIYQGGEWITVRDQFVKPSTSLNVTDWGILKPNMKAIQGQWSSTDYQVELETPDDLNGQSLGVVNIPAGETGGGFITMPFQGVLSGSSSPEYSDDLFVNEGRPISIDLHLLYSGPFQPPASQRTLTAHYFADGELVDSRTIDYATLSREVFPAAADFNNPTAFYANLLGYQFGMRVTGTVLPTTVASADEIALTVEIPLPAGSGAEKKLAVWSIDSRVQVPSTGLADGAVTTEKIAVGAITAESGIIGSIDAGKITVGTLDSARIAANSITADKVLIGSAVNLIANPGFELGPTGGAGWDMSGGVVVSTAQKRSGSRSALIPPSSSETATLAEVQTIRVSVGDKLYVSAWVRGDADSVGSGSHSGGFRIHRADTGSEVSSGWASNRNFPRTATADTWFHVENEWTSTYEGFVYFRIAIASSTRNGNHWIDDIRVAPKATATLIADGAITTPKIAVGAITAESGVVASLDAGKITVGTLDVARLAANSITADKVLLSSGSDLIADPFFDGQGAAWGSSAGSAAFSYSPEAAYDGHDYGVLAQPNAGATGAFYFPFMTGSGSDKKLQADIDTTYTVEVWVRRTAGDVSNVTSVDTRVYSYPNPTGGTLTNGAASGAKLTTPPPANTWVKLTGTWKAPNSNSTFFSPRLTVYTSGAHAANPAKWHLGMVSVRAQVGSTLIEPGAITTEKIATGAITAESGVIGSLDASKITVGKLSGARLEADAINGMQIIGATIATSTTFPRAQMDTTGISAYSSSSVRTFFADASTGEVSITGKLFTGKSGFSRVSLDPTLWSSMPVYDDDGNVAGYANGAGVRVGIDASNSMDMYHAGLSGSVRSGVIRGPGGVAKVILNGSAVQVQGESSASTTSTGFGGRFHVRTKSKTNSNEYSVIESSHLSVSIDTYEGSGNSSGISTNQGSARLNSTYQGKYSSLSASGGDLTLKTYYGGYDTSVVRLVGSDTFGSTYVDVSAEHINPLRINYEGTANSWIVPFKKAGTNWGYIGSSAAMSVDDFGIQSGAGKRLVLNAGTGSAKIILDTDGSIQGLPIATGDGVSFATVAANGGSQTATINFPSGKFSVAPSVSAMTSHGRVTPVVFNITKTGFSFRVWNFTSSSATSVVGSWMAVAAA